MGLIIKNIIWLFLSVVVPVSLAAQENGKNISAEISALYSVSQDQYGVDDELINGFPYPLPNSRIQGHPYLTDEWNEGKLYIHGRVFADIPVKYDLILDEIIIKVKVEDDIERLIKVNRFQIDSLLVDSSLFVNAATFFYDKTSLGFYEKIYSGKLSLFRKHEKRFIGIYSTISPQGKYSDLKTGTFIFSNNKFSPVDTKKSFLNYFKKEDQKEIKKFIRANAINYKKASRSQLTELMNFSTQLIPR